MSIYIQGFAEPLLGIWAPEALSQLARNVARGALSLCKVVREMSGKIVLPTDGRWIEGADTPEDWEAAIGIVRSEVRVLCEVWLCTSPEGLAQSLYLILPRD